MEMQLIPLASQMERTQMTGNVQTGSLRPLILVLRRGPGKPMNLCKIILKLVTATEEAMGIAKIAQANDFPGKLLTASRLAHSPVHPPPRRTLTRP